MPSAFAALANTKSVQSGGSRLAIGEYLCESVDCKTITDRKGVHSVVLDYRVISAEKSNFGDPVTDLPLDDLPTEVGSIRSSKQQLGEIGNQYVVTMLLSVLGVSPGSPGETVAKACIPAILDAKKTGVPQALPDGSMVTGQELVGRRFRMSVRPKKKSVATVLPGGQQASVEVRDSYNKELFFVE